MAADLTLAGREVLFCAHPGARGTFLETQQLGRIEMTGYGRRGVARPAEITTDLARVLGAARQVHLLLPAIRHLELFEALAPHLRDDHQVVVWSGNFGSLRLAEFLRARGGPSPLIGETSTVPYSTRVARPGEVHIQALATWILVAALPATRTAELMDACAPLWPGVVRPAVHVLQAAFSNPNTIVHAPPAILNLGRIERTQGDFFVYAEGITPSVSRIVGALHAELGAVASAFGFQTWDYQPDDFAPPASVVTAVFQGPQAIDELSRSRGPSGARHRYLTEDIPYGLVPIGRLGRLAGVATPLLDALVTLGSAASEQDFWATGPTLEALGLPWADPASVRRYLLGMD